MYFKDLYHRLPSENKKLVMVLKKGRLVNFKIIQKNITKVIFIFTEIELVKKKSSYIMSYLRSMYIIKGGFRLGECARSFGVLVLFVNQ